jgi:peptide deformylase
LAILKIARMGHPALSRPAAPIEDPTAPAVRRFIADMIETMVDAHGVGLAAPQVHVGRRLVIFYVPEDEEETEDEMASDDGPTDDGSGPQPLTVLINPEIEILGDEMSVGWEGCLSVPGMTGAVARPDRILYRGLTPEGEILERTASGFHARVVQHECDHLDGILYPQRMTDLSQFGFNEEMAKRHGDEDRRAADEDEGRRAADEEE